MFKHRHTFRASSISPEVTRNNNSIPSTYQAEGPRRWGLDFTTKRKTVLSRQMLVPYQKQEYSDLFIFQNSNRNYILKIIIFASLYRVFVFIRYSRRYAFVFKWSLHDSFLKRIVCAMNQSTKH